MKIWLAVLLIALFFTWGCTREKQDSPVNVLVVVIDTIGAEYVGSYDGGDATPVLDQLAAGGVRFERAYSTAPWTKPAVASLLTGKMPYRHGLTALPGKLSQDQVTLAELFQAGGYHTTGIVSHYFIGSKYDFNQGFTEFFLETDPRQAHEVITSQRVSDRALAWLRSYQEQKQWAPFFLFVHYFDPHYFFQHHPDFDRTTGYQGSLEPGIHIRKLRDMSAEMDEADLKYLKNLYREEIAYTDYHIGRLLTELEQQGLAENTLVIFTADHGEEFMRHGWIGHTRTLYDELIRIPLIFSWPGRLKPAVIGYPASLIDILPTLADLTNAFKTPADVQGQSLAAQLMGAAPPAGSRSIFAEVDFKSSRRVKDANKACVVRDDWKLIFDKNAQSYEYYHLAQDPEELNELISQGSEPPPDLREKLTAFLARQSAGTAGEVEAEPILDPDEIEQLQSLGYM